jgi:hypothetical protein
MKLYPNRMLNLRMADLYSLVTKYRLSSTSLHLQLIQNAYSLQQQQQQHQVRLNRLSLILE